MGSKKRNSGVSEEETKVELDSPKPLKKKPKKEDGEREQHISDGSSVKPMERKKKRKALDKQRRRATTSTSTATATAAVDLEVKPAAQSVDSVTTTSSGSSSGGALPEFHIGVFKDLAAAAESVREAAVKQMVMELKEVQNAYDALEANEKEIGDGGFKLEAEKDDGLDDCAPSVRYAVRRLIRGVSSSFIFSIV